MQRFDNTGFPEVYPKEMLEQNTAAGATGVLGGVWLVKAAGFMVVVIVVDFMLWPFCYVTPSYRVDDDGEV